MDKQLTLFDTESGATLSKCGQYRYSLWRIWDTSRPLVAFIGLNPSTADAEKNDPTIKRCIAFASQWGYGGFYMLNLFALRATDPAVMLQHPDPIGKATDHIMRRDIKYCQEVVFMWGVPGSHLGRDKAIIDRYPYARCFGKNGDGSPKHPLYLPKTSSHLNFSQ